MLTIAAPAKINLALHVLGRRDDGYHLLDSLVVFAGAGDRVTAAPDDSLSLTITGPFAATLTAEADNLVLRAAHWLKARSGTTKSAKLTLEKNLPVASGIGGGSSDAAAALIACAKLWGLDPHTLPRAETAALGADVPVCLARAPALMRGIGEDVTLVSGLPRLAMVLANPGLPLATKTVFGALRGRFGGPLAPLPADMSVESLLAYLLRQRNDLLPPALDSMPVIGTVLDALAATPGCRLARLSGSGPTCFGLYAGEAEAQAAAATLKATHPDWWCVAAPLLTAPP